MKKVSISTVDTIIGGTKPNCSVEYVKEGKVCNAVTTCVDKNGKIVSSKSTETVLTDCGTLAP